MPGSSRADASLPVANLMFVCGWTSYRRFDSLGFAASLNCVKQCARMLITCIFTGHSRGVPQLLPWVATACPGKSRGTPQEPRAYPWPVPCLCPRHVPQNCPLLSTAVPRQLSRYAPWRPPWQALRQIAASHGNFHGNCLGNLSRDPHGYGHGKPRQATETPTAILKVTAAPVARRAAMLISGHRNTRGKVSGKTCGKARGSTHGEFRG